ncbi:MAG: 16S rRNA (uracil(1498)-N(3))-methyltransferase [Rhodobacteraceae bacterium]|nr:16S rRNA (uracil(1498)-N(3))-methyltransferase [Paracoccaceae bacterium]MCY4196497.1 16S rRNA (uracil(1498)-N(3))-methyltransferase [Paracoccaceae bacterium]
MPHKPVKSRLFVEQPLAEAQRLALSSGQSHYLCRSLRLGVGGRVSVFNGHDGEWLAELVETGRAAKADCIRQIRSQFKPSNIRLLMSPLRPARTEFAVEKATELGVSRITFVSTDHAVKRAVNFRRLRAIAVEAAEQCGGMSLPKIDGVISLDDELVNWPTGCQLLFCDELATSDCGFPSLAADQATAVLVGPEGGFSVRERARIDGLQFSVRISLGCRVLRAETAVTAALALVNTCSLTRSGACRTWQGKDIGA